MLVVAVVDEGVELVVQAAHEPSTTNTKAVARETRFTLLDLLRDSACGGTSSRFPHP